MKWYINVLKKYAVFNGRAQRKEYWSFVLFNTIFLIMAILLDNLLGIANEELGFGIISIIYLLAMILPSLAVTVRRLHDIGKSGKWVFISFVPYIGIIWLLVLLATDSKPSKNIYGENPKEINIQNIDESGEDLKQSFSKDEPAASSPLSSNTLAESIFSNFNVANGKEFQSVINYWCVQKTLRKMAKFLIIGGLFFILLGFTINEKEMMYYSITIGALLMLQSILIFSVPTRAWLIVGGIIFLWMGLSWIFTAIIYSKDFINRILLGLAGLFLIVWGLRNFMIFKQFSYRPMAKPSKDKLKSFDEFVKSIIKTNAKEKFDFIQFISLNEKNNIFELCHELLYGLIEEDKSSWKGRLFDDALILVKDSYDYAIFADKREIEPLKIIKHPTKSNVITIKIGGKKFFGLIEPEFMDRFETWLKKQ